VSKKGSKNLNAALSRIVSAAERFAPGVVVLYFLLTILLLYYTANNLGINTNTEEMLDENLHFRRVYQKYNEVFPEYDGNILIVVDGITAERAYEAASTLTDHLRNKTDLFETVYMPGGGDFFKKHAFLYQEMDDLQDMADNLATFQPFLAYINHDQSLRGFFSILNRVIETDPEEKSIDLSLLFANLEKAFETTLTGEPYELSWLTLMYGKTMNPEDLRQFIIVQPKLDFSKLFPARTPINFIRGSIRTLSLDEPDHGVQVRLTGDVALEHEELLSVMQGVGIAGGLALIFVGILLSIGLGSFSLVAATLSTLAVGLVCTAGFATAAVGHLNLISIAFAVLYIGLSVDYAIHFCLRYKELIEQGNLHSMALRQTARSVGSSLVLCAFTTAAAFYAFIPTAFVGVAELGLISGTSMFIALIANLTLLPAILSLMPLKRKKVSGKRRFSGGLLNGVTSIPLKHARVVLITAIVAGTTGITLFPRIVFDPNPLNLRDPSSESVATFKELLSDKQASPWYLNILASGENDAKKHARRLNHLEPVDNTITIDDFVPAEQEEKLAVIDDISMILGPALMGDTPLPPPPVSDQIAAINGFGKTLEIYTYENPDSALSVSAKVLLDQISHYEKMLESQPNQKEMLRSLEQRLLASLPMNLKMLQASFSAAMVTRERLPQSLVERWVSEDGYYRVQVMPSDNLNNYKAMDQFVSAVRQFAPDAVGYPVIILGAGEAVASAFQQAFLLALVFIAFLLFILFRSISDPFRILISLILAGVLTGATMVILNIPFNFANVIALPLIMGIGVDSGIHMVHRIRTAPPSDGHILKSSTARAILFSALTTLSGFGNLAFTSHRGMASMGQLLSIGIFFTLLCTLILLPSLIKPTVRTKQIHG
jgi:uncharacterized protein